MGAYIKRCTVCRTNLLMGNDILKPYDTFRGAYYCLDHLPGKTQGYTHNSPTKPVTRAAEPTPQTTPEVPAKIDIKVNIGGEVSDVTVNRRATDRTFMTDLENRGLLNVSRSVDILLAHAEAERQVNDWLDTLNDPTASAEAKQQARELLAKGAEDYRWLTAQRTTLGSLFARIDD